MLACAQDVLTNESVVKMVKAGLSERVILSMVSSQPPAYSVTPDTLIELKSAGVSDRIVAAMVERNAGAGPVSVSYTHLSRTVRFSEAKINEYLQRCHVKPAAGVEAS